MFDNNFWTDAGAGTVLCQEMDEAWVQEGIDAYNAGLPIDTLWNPLQRAGYRSIQAIAGQLSYLVGDPLLAKWILDGSPGIEMTRLWGGLPSMDDVLPNEQREDYIGE